MWESMSRTGAGAGVEAGVGTGAVAVAVAQARLWHQVAHVGGKIENVVCYCEVAPTLAPRFRSFPRLEASIIDFFWHAIVC